MRLRQILIAQNLGYLNSPDSQEVLEDAAELGRILNGLIFFNQAGGLKLADVLNPHTCNVVARTEN